MVFFHLISSSFFFSYIYWVKATTDYLYKFSSGLSSLTSLASFSRALNKSLLFISSSSSSSPISPIGFSMFFLLAATTTVTPQPLCCSAVLTKFWILHSTSLNFGFFYFSSSEPALIIIHWSSTSKSSFFHQSSFSSVKYLSTFSVLSLFHKSQLSSSLSKSPICLISSSIYFIASDLYWLIFSSAVTLS